MKLLESLSSTVRHAGLDLASTRFCGSSQNAVYEFVDASGRPRILRVTAGSHRSPAEILDELAFVRLLHQRGVAVCPPVPHLDGTWVFSDQNATGDFHAVVFEKAAGSALVQADLGAELYHAHGSLLGVIHAAARQEPRPRLSARRPWDEERYFTTDIAEFLPAEHHQPLRAVWDEIRHALTTVPLTAETHGPVHLDLGYANLHLDGARLQAFDFDNCSTGPFILDIAAALYGSIFTGLRCEQPGDRGAFDQPRSGQNLERVWRAFLDGYATRHPLPPMPASAMRACFDVLYFRSVVHAWRMQQPLMTPARRQALDADVQHLLHRTLPLNFDFNSGHAVE